MCIHPEVNLGQSKETTAGILLISYTTWLSIDYFMLISVSLSLNFFIVLEFKIIFHKTKAQLTLEQYGLNFSGPLIHSFSSYNKYVQYCRCIYSFL